MTMKCEKEHRILRGIARQSMNRDDAALLEENVRTGVQWPFIMFRAIEEGIAPLLYHHFKNLNLLETIPEYALEVFARLYAETMLLNRHMATVLSELEGALEGSEIQVIVLKGAALFTTVYHDIALRPMEDIDLMVRPEHQDGVEAILRERGFVSDPLYPMTFRRGVMTVDLHNDFLSAHRIRSRREVMRVPSRDIWARSVPAAEGAHHVFRLSLYDNLIALSSHLLKHRFYRLIWFVDIRESIEADSELFDWTEFVEHVGNIRAKKAVLYALLLAKCLLTMDVPDYVLDGLGKGGLSAIEKYILRLRLADAPPGTVTDVLWVLQISGWVKRLQFTMENIFPRREVMNQIFPDSSHRVPVFLKRAAAALSQVASDGASAFRTVVKGGLPPL